MAIFQRITTSNNRSNTDKYKLRMDEYSCQRNVPPKHQRQRAGHVPPSHDSHDSHSKTGRVEEELSMEEPETTAEEEKEQIIGEDNTTTRNGRAPGIISRSFDGSSILPIMIVWKLTPLMTMTWRMEILNTEMCRNPQQQPRRRRRFLAHPRWNRRVIEIPQSKMPADEVRGTVGDGW